MPRTDSPSDSIPQRLGDLRNGLLHLHKTLLDSESKSYDREMQRITSPGQLFELVLHDPWFAWLHALSELVVLIDESMDGKQPPTAADARRFVAQARNLLAPADSGGDFRKHYLEALQRDPDVVMAHSETMKLLAALQHL